MHSLVPLTSTDVAMGGPISSRPRPARTGDFPRYVNLIYTGQNDGFIVNEKLFHAEASETPLLRADYTNTVVLMPGAFNPPHYGHIELMKHILECGAPELNIVAMVILPSDDTRLARKFADQRKPLLFTKQQRVDLLRGDSRLPGNVWVYQDSEASWHEFRRCLEENCSRDGFPLNFVSMCGPDYVRINVVHDPIRWDTTKVLVSDACRRADFRVEGTNNLIKLSACTEWRGVPYETWNLRRLVERKGTHRYQHLFRVGSPDGAERERQIWTEETWAESRFAMQRMSECQVTPANPPNNIRNGVTTNEPAAPARTPIVYRFVPWNEEVRRKPEVSSSQIRCVIATFPNDRLFYQLKDQALSHEMLFQMCMDMTDRLERDVDAELPDSQRPNPFIGVRW